MRTTAAGASLHAGGGARVQPILMFQPAGFQFPASILTAPYWFPCFLRFPLLAFFPVIDDDAFLVNSAVKCALPSSKTSASVAQVVGHAHVKCVRCFRAEAPACTKVKSAMLIDRSWLWSGGRGRRRSCRRGRCTRWTVMLPRISLFEQQRTPAQDSFFQDATASLSVDMSTAFTPIWLKNVESSTSFAFKMKSPVTWFVSAALP